MKKLFLCLTALALVMLMLSSCSSQRRDCQGVRHYKQKGGFYM